MVWPIFKRTMLPIANLWVKKVNGIENIPKNHGFILTSNHPGWWDPIFIIATITPFLNKKVHFIANPKFWFLGDAICRKWGGAIPVYKHDKGESGIREALRLLKNNKIVGIFPEGISKPTKKLRGKLGIARLAIESKKPVIPIGLNGIDELAPRGSIFPKKLKRITINIGKHMNFSNYYDKPYNKKILREVTNMIVVDIESLLD